MHKGTGFRLIDKNEVRALSTADVGMKSFNRLRRPFFPPVVVPSFRRFLVSSAAVSLSYSSFFSFVNDWKLSNVHRSGTRLLVQRISERFSFVGTFFFSLKLINTTRLRTTRNFKYTYLSICLKLGISSNFQTSLGMTESPLKFQNVEMFLKITWKTAWNVDLC